MYIRIGEFKKLIVDVMIGEVSIYINNQFEIKRTCFKNGMEEFEELQLGGEYYTIDDYEEIRKILENL